MFTRFQRIAGVLIATLVLLVAAGAAAQGDVTVFPTALGVHHLLSAHIWAMGGVSSALPQGANGLLPNPAAAALTEKQEVIIGTMSAEMVAALLMYDVPAADGPGAGEQFVTPLSREKESADPPAPRTPESPSPEQSLFADDFHLGLAGRCGPGSQLGWGIVADISPQRDARLFQLGLLHRIANECSLGLNYSRILAAGRPVVSTAALGAAYESNRCTLALDLFTTAGYPPQGIQALLGVEYRLGNGLAVRAGSAGGNLTYGVGYRKNGWSVDIARLTTTHGELVFPDTALRSADDLAMVSVSYSR